MRATKLEHTERLKTNLKRLETTHVDELVVFTSKDRKLYKRLHEYRKYNQIASTLRELIDLGLKVKGY